MSYVVPRKRDRVLLLRETCPDRGVRDNLLHSIQDSALCPWSRLLSRDRQLQDASWENWAHRLWDWQQTCPRILTFGMKSHSSLHESLFGFKKLMSARLRPRRYCPNRGSVLDCSHKCTIQTHETTGSPELATLSHSSLPFLFSFLLQLSFLCATVSKEECLISDRLGFRGSGCRIVQVITQTEETPFVLASTYSVTFTDRFSGAVEEQNVCAVPYSRMGVEVHHPITGTYVPLGWAGKPLWLKLMLWSWPKSCLKTFTRFRVPTSSTRINQLSQPGSLPLQPMKMRRFSLEKLSQT